MRNIENMRTWQIAEYLREKRDCAFILWGKDDIEDVIINRIGENLEYPNECIKEIVRRLNQVDSEAGIDWELIEDISREVLSEYNIIP